MKIKNFLLKEIDLDKFVEKYFKLIIIIFLLLIVISRLYKFGELPNAIHLDEAGESYDAYSLANYGTDRYLNSFPVYLINFGGGQSALYAYLDAFLIKITGQDNIFITRLPELLMFLMAIFLIYKLVNKMQDKKTALLVTFLVIICPWHIIQSRFGLDCNLLRTNVYTRFIFIRNSKEKLSIYASRNIHRNNIIYIWFVIYNFTSILIDMECL